MKIEDFDNARHLKYERERLQKFKAEFGREITVGVVRNTLFESHLGCSVLVPFESLPEHTRTFLLTECDRQLADVDRQLAALGVDLAA